MSDFDSDLTGRDSRFRGLLESAPDAMVTVDKTGAIVLINSQTEQLFGYLREELLGQSVAVTASAMVGDRDKVVITSGFDGYISKPITPETFVAEVEGHLHPAEGHGDHSGR